MILKIKKSYYIENRDKILQKKKEYYQKNKEILKEKMKLWGAIWYQNNKEKIRKIHRDYYWDNKRKESQRYKIIYQHNKEKVLEKNKEYYWKNLEIIRERHKKYNKNNKKKIMQYKKEWQKIQRKINPRYRLSENIGSSIARSLKGIKSGHPWQIFVDYTLEDLIKHLEKKFDRNMNWENYGTYWAVDYIKPKSLFSYISVEDLQFKECWALKNLQPLEKIENIKKRNYYLQ